VLQLAIMTERRDYMRDRGFALVDDVGHRFMEDAARSMPVTEITPQIVGGRSFYLDNPSAGALRLVSAVFAGSIRQMNVDMRRENFAAYDVTTRDTDQSTNQFVFTGGLEDLDFTWHFAPAVANSVVQEFHKQGYISKTQYDAMTLGDWADMIGSKWFGELMHDMALARNGAYSTFGTTSLDYSEGEIGRFFSAPDIDNVFAVSSAYEDKTDQTFLTAELSKEARRHLRKGMQERKSPGCPVARHAGTLSLDLIDGDPHAKNLIARGDIVILSRDEEAGKARFVQEYTPINRALDGLALLLDEYDTKFGTPYFQLTNPDIHHDQRPATNILVQQGNTPFVSKPTSQPDEPSAVITRNPASVSRNVSAWSIQSDLDIVAASRAEGEQAKTAPDVPDAEHNIQEAEQSGVFTLEPDQVADQTSLAEQDLHGASDQIEVTIIDSGGSTTIYGGRDDDRNQRDDDRDER
jgi:hypothetical protein